MLSILTQAWRDLPATGKTIVAVVVLLAITGLLVMAMWLGYRLDWLPGIIGQVVGQ